MKRMLVSALSALVLSASVVAVASPPADAEPRPPRVVYKYAKQMNCKYPEAVRMASGGRNIGIHCVVRNRHIARTEFYIIRYANIARATDYWRDWLSWDDDYSDGPTAFFAKRGRVIVTDQSPTGDDYYGKPETTYAANRIGGRLMSGYRY